MYRFICLMCLLIPIAKADTIDHFMNIASNIPKMEMKADPQSQAWARSARNILTLTSECIAESLMLANESATARGEPLFCLPSGGKIDAEKLTSLIQQTYQNLSGLQSDKDKLTVSQIALMGLKKEYPCQSQPQAASSNPFQQSNPQTSQANQNPFYRPPSPMQHQDGLPALG
ncbi:phosphatase [Legionella impletisoli]|uniref:Phosphatase n=1 Tax=Legionella impletisoli TaxID=343510 RepID=A0A917JZX1_9GAMM|nr:phosphatase [Legionella impletisoli]GGI90194.1 hypothetical protein GCM10007966_18740 [Legionella impletisoli]